MFNKKLIKQKILYNSLYKLKCNKFLLIQMKWKSDIMARYVCMYCGYVFDEEKGDPEYNIAPGTKLADMPDDWHCPECHQGKDAFVLEEDN